MVTRQIGAIIARGNTSDVHAWGQRSVIKLLRAEMPARWAQREATNSHLVRAVGLPAPEVDSVVTVDGRRGIVFERIDGPSMWDQMRRNPADIDRLSRQLADLQAEINSTPAPSGLPSLRSRLRTNIREAELLTEDDTLRAHDLLAVLPEGTSLCHFDMHPNNVLLTERGPMVIDWFDAACGDAVADIVRSSVLLRSEAFETHLGGADPQTVRRIHDMYVWCVKRRRNLDTGAVLRWEPAVLAGRLAEPLGERVLAATSRAFRQPDCESPLRAALESVPVE